MASLDKTMSSGVAVADFAVVAAGFAGCVVAVVGRTSLSLAPNFS
jgi:hypothetical protein